MHVLAHFTRKGDSAPTSHSHFMPPLLLSTSALERGGPSCFSAPSDRSALTRLLPRWQLDDFNSVYVNDGLDAMLAIDLELEVVRCPSSDVLRWLSYPH
jgi:hypothetical protein